MKTPSNLENSSRKNVLLAVVAIILIVILCGIYFSGQKSSESENSPHSEWSARKVDRVFTDARGYQTSSANEELLKRFNKVKFDDLKNDWLRGILIHKLRKYLTQVLPEKRFLVCLHLLASNFGMAI